MCVAQTYIIQQVDITGDETINHIVNRSRQRQLPRQMDNLGFVVSSSRITRGRILNISLSNLYSIERGSTRDSRSDYGGSAVYHQVCVTYTPFFAARDNIYRRWRRGSTREVSRCIYPGWPGELSYERSSRSHRVGRIVPCQKDAFDLFFLKSTTYKDLSLN
jgi:hypothetical protein